VQSIYPRYRIEQESDHPGLIGRPLKPLSYGQRFDTRSIKLKATKRISTPTSNHKDQEGGTATYISNRIQAQIYPIGQLSSNSTIPHQGIQRLLICRFSSGAEMLHILANTHQFPRQPELLLDRFIDLDLRRWMVGAVEVPCVEAGEVLERPEELVTADCAVAVSSLTSAKGGYIGEVLLGERRVDLLVVATNFR